MKVCITIVVVPAYITTRKHHDQSMMDLGNADLGCVDSYCSKSTPPF